MLRELNDQDRAERDAIIDEIRASFARVIRGARGISWNECFALDDWESPAACRAARQSDADTHWTELVENPDWEPFPGNGGFAFINAQGFRYYLPPTMIRFLHNQNSEWYPGHLLESIQRFVTPGPLWSAAQLRAIARFISFMARYDEDACYRSHEPNAWAEALDRHWNAYLSE